MLEHLGSELTRDPANLIERAPHGFLRLVDLIAPFRRRVRDRVELQEDARQQLADLVVEIARDAHARGLVRRDHSLAALSALGFESVEHLVERTHDVPDFVVLTDCQALARPQEIDCVHSLRQALQRRDRPP